MWLLTLALIAVLPCIMIAGFVMTKFETRYKIQQLDWSTCTFALYLKGLLTSSLFFWLRFKASRGGNLAEECISSIRTLVAFGNQALFSSKYDTFNSRVLDLGLSMATFHAIGLAAFFFFM